MEMKKTPTGSSDDGGDKDPIKKNLKISHTIYTSAKRQMDTQKTGLGIPETQQNPWVVDVDELIEKASWVVQRLLETQEIIEALVTQEPEILEEESVTLHHMAYNRVSKKLITKKLITKKKKGIQEMEINKLFRQGCTIKSCTIP